MAGPTDAGELTSARLEGGYDPELDAALRYPDWVVGQVHLGWGLHEVLSLRHRVVLVERSDSPAVQRCSLAHAVAHLDLGHGEAAPGFFDARQELEASLLAAKRLITIDHLSHALAWTASPAELAAELQVDPCTLALRCSRLTSRELEHLEAAGCLLACAA